MDDFSNFFGGPKPNNQPVPQVNNGNITVQIPTQTVIQGAGFIAGQAVNQAIKPNPTGPKDFGAIFGMQGNQPATSPTNPSNQANKGPTNPPQNPPVPQNPPPAEDKKKNFNKLFGI